MLNDQIETWMKDKPFTVEFEESQGRFCRASEDIPTGTVISTDLYYAAVVDHSKVKEVCSYCFYGLQDDHEADKVLSPCPICEEVYYCSAQCRQMDQLYHSQQYECKILHALHNGAADRWTQSNQYIELVSQLRMLIRLLARRHAEEIRVHSDYIPQNIKAQLNTNPFNFSDYLSFVTNAYHYSERLLSFIHNTVSGSCFQAVHVEILFLTLLSLSLTLAHSTHSRLALMGMYTMIICVCPRWLLMRSN